jgi:hypothetical protein
MALMSARQGSASIPAVHLSLLQSAAEFEDAAQQHRPQLDPLLFNTRSVRARRRAPGRRGTATLLCHQSD